MERLAALSSHLERNFDQQVVFLQRLVQTNSTNPFLPETSLVDAPVEKAMAAVTYEELHRLGLNAMRVGLSHQRPNVVCHLAGTGRSEKTLLLTTHMDMVEPTGYTRDPWGAVVEYGRLYGVGAADAKAQIAAMIYAVHAVREVGIALAGNLTLAFVVDEESGACSPYGTQYLFEQGILQGTAAIVGEPGSDKMSTAA